MKLTYAVMLAEQSIELQEGSNKTMKLEKELDDLTVSLEKTFTRIKELIAYSRFIQNELHSASKDIAACKAFHLETYNLARQLSITEGAKEWEKMKVHRDHIKGIEEANTWREGLNKYLNPAKEKP